MKKPFRLGAFDNLDRVQSCCSDYRTVKLSNVTQGNAFNHFHVSAEFVCKKVENGVRWIILAIGQKTDCELGDYIWRNRRVLSNGMPSDRLPL
jgi:hypothetical protein